MTQRRIKITMKPPIFIFKFEFFLTFLAFPALLFTLFFIFPRLDTDPISFPSKSDSSVEVPKETFSPAPIISSCNCILCENFSHLAKDVTIKLLPIS